jgi:CheY-like chemotaxis protein
MHIANVLLVDDDPDIRSIGRLSLESVGGWTVLQAASGAEALDIARRSPPDVILLDVMMPGMDGPATLAALRADPDTARIPVIFITARLQPNDLGHYMSLGVAGVIPKPFDPMRLAGEVRAMVEGDS